MCFCPTSPPPRIFLQISKEACERIRSKDTLLVKNPALRTICLGSRSLPARPVAPVAGATKQVADVVREVASAGRSDNRIAAVGEKSAIPAKDTAGLDNREVLAASRLDARFEAAPLRPPSYPGIQTDPAGMLLNGEAMKASFAAPDVRLANFDK